MKKPLIITTGEPAGIGPDIVLLLWQKNPDLFLSQKIVIAASPELLQLRAIQLQITRPLDQLPLISIPLKDTCIPGKLNANNSAYVIEQLSLATQGCLDHQFSGIITGPIHKGIVNDAGFSFSGHTDFFTRFTQTDRTVMLMMTSALKVALFSDHVPLSTVSHLLTQEALSRCLAIICHDFHKRFKIEYPKILVCGLNPHAGESGYLGHEEKEIIIPVLESLKKQEHFIMGPIAADVAFTKEMRRKADVILAMYHDQGLIPLKYEDFHQAVNVTLGLPFVRTSVSHGTALDIAGSGHADPSSLLQAISLAITLSENSSENFYDSLLPTPCT